MDMPTPCPRCMDIVELNNMEKLDNELICSDCADSNRCEMCECVSHDVSSTKYGQLCSTCFSESREDDEEY